MSHYSMDCYDMYRCKFLSSGERQTCVGANCKRTIEPGQKFAHIDTQHDDDRRTYIRCGACQVLHEHLTKVGEPNWMFPAEMLDCGKAYADEHGCEPPVEIQALAFLDSEEAAALLEGREEPDAWDEREISPVWCPVCDGLLFEYHHEDDGVLDRTPDSDCDCESKTSLDENNVCMLGDGQRYRLNFKDGVLVPVAGEGAA